MNTKLRALPERGGGKKKVLTAQELHRQEATAVNKKDKDTAGTNLLMDSDPDDG
jgi:hypothetical protein